jgi:hypothetical protein
MRKRARREERDRKKCFAFMDDPLCITAAEELNCFDGEEMGGGGLITKC